MVQIGHSMVEKGSKFFVTGATGMVGSYIISELLRSGYYNISFNYRSKKSLDSLRYRVEKDGFGDLFNRLTPCKCNLDNSEELREYLDDVDTVIGCAAEVNLGNSRYNLIVRKNIDITRVTLTAAKAAKVRRYIHLSSIATLGHSEQEDKYIDEDNKPTSLKGHSSYTISKFYAEAEVWREINSGMDCVILNPGVVLGVGRKRSGSGEIFNIARRGIPAISSGVTGYVGARDVAKSVIAAINGGVAGERYIIVSENLALKELITYMAKQFNVKAPQIIIPDKIIKTVGKIVGFLKIRSRFSKSFLRTLITKSYYSNTKSIDSLDLTYTPIKSVIEECCLEIEEQN